jgi:prolyl oligopeptidase
MRLTAIAWVIVSSACATGPGPAPNVPVAAPAAATAPAPAPAFVYPPAKRGGVTDTLHGHVVADPYRWLEELDSPDTTAFVAAQNALADAAFSKLSTRDAFRARLARLTSTESYGLFSRHGGSFFWTHSDGKQDQRVLFHATRLDGQARVLLDPNVVSPDGSLAFVGSRVSPDGKRLAYGLSIGGGDWQKWRFRAVPASPSVPPSDAPDELEHIKYYRPTFTLDGKAVYYSRFPAPAPGKELSETDHDCKVYRHLLGTPVAKDMVVYERPEHPSWQFEPLVTADGKSLVITIGDGEVGDRGQEQLVVIDLTTPGARPRALVDSFEAEYDYVGREGPILFVKTNLDAPTKRILAIDLRRPEKKAWRELVPAGKNVIEAASLAGHQLFITTLQDAQSVVTAYDLKGTKLRDVALPGIGSVWGFGGNPDDTELAYAFTSFLTPGAVYRYDVKSGASVLWKRPELPGFDASRYQTTQVFYLGKDGTRVPMFITARKGVALDGTNPTLLSAYGGFGISLTPHFGVGTAAWLEQGGVYAQANLRGGGEYGEAWHQAGTRTHKQVVFDDFIAAGEWLIANRYASKETLGVYGGSNGGLLIGAVLTQRPDLFGATAALSGVLDMVRFARFGQGAGWEGDYGSIDRPDELAALLAYSPVHNVRPGTRYPPTLVVTADHDVRVAPLHSYKFAAALQAAQAGPAPVLLRVETTSGHGGGTTRTSQIAQEADLLAFFLENLGGPKP